MFTNFYFASAKKIFVSSVFNNQDKQKGCLSSLLESYEIN